MNRSNKTDLSRREKLRERGGALVAVIPLRFASTLYLLVPMVICVLFGLLSSPHNDFVRGGPIEMGKISVIAFGLAALLLALAILRPLLTKVKVYERGLELRSPFRVRILFPEEIEYLRTGQLRGSPVIGRQTMFQDSMDHIKESRRGFICIKPLDGKEICLTYKSYGQGLDALLDWQSEHGIPDETGTLPIAR